MKTIFLVDGDNNIGTGLTGVDMLSDQDTVLIFYQKEKGLALSKLQKLCAGTAADVQYIESVRGGKNSIDFQIITELGVLVGKREADYAYVISQDKGYAASIDALQARYANAFQEVALRPSIESCLHLPFVLRSADRQELCNALVKEYGSAQGCALYNHLKRIFQAPEPEPEKAVKVTRPRRAAAGKSPPFPTQKNKKLPAPPVRAALFFRFSRLFRQHSTKFDKFLVFSPVFCYDVSGKGSLFLGLDRLSPHMLTQTLPGG